VLEGHALVALLAPFAPRLRGAAAGLAGASSIAGNPGGGPEGYLPAAAFGIHKVLGLVPGTPRLRLRLNRPPQPS